MPHASTTSTCQHRLDSRLRGNDTFTEEALLTHCFESHATCQASPWSQAYFALDVTTAQNAPMQLIGMLDSPYVRRVAISLQLLELPFEHRSVSVFRQFAEFQAINPVVKAPTLVCDDGQVLMDSSLILDFAEALACPRSLLPRALVLRQQALRTIGLALAACEKSVQLVYEQQLRPTDKQYAPWVARITAQLLAACDDLEADLSRNPLNSLAIDQAGVSTAVAWTFIQALVPQAVDANHYPELVAWAAQAEQRPEFKAAPHSDLTYVQTN